VSNNARTCRSYTVVLRLGLTWLGLSVLSLPMLLGQGCERRGAQPATGGSAETEGVTLPDWAPKDPSPAFLRAAKVLKPLPEEVQSYSPLYPAAYELFGTLTDEQLEDFLKPKQRRLPLRKIPEERRGFYKEHFGAEQVGNELVYWARDVKIPFTSLTSAQREAFDRLAEAYDESQEVSPDQVDLLVRLYKAGAKEDLSNVQISFNATGGPTVGLAFIIAVSPEKAAGISGGRFAQLRVWEHEVSSE